MGTLQVGHGSEFHLLRFLGRHRELLNSRLETQLAADGVEQVASVEWLDFPFKPAAPTRDGEILSVDFLADHGGAAWQSFWPDPESGKFNRRGMPSWDAVGHVRFKGSSRKEWLLVEAKAHTKEFSSPGAACGAAGRSRQSITEALRSTFGALCPKQVRNWESFQDQSLGQYYQLANRLAVLHFLNACEQPARLLYVLFAGDQYRICPPTSLSWSKLFTSAYREMGLELDHPLSSRCHRLCLHVKSGERV